MGGGADSVDALERVRVVPEPVSPFATAIQWLTPLLAPVAVALNFDMIWFGVLVVTVAEIGLITPPVGMNLFVVQATVPGLKQATVVRGILPFILADFVRLALLVAFPAITLWMAT